LNDDNKSFRFLFGDVRATIYHIKARRLIQTTNVKGLYHEKHQNFCRSYRSGRFFWFFAAETVTATAATMDGAEAKIAAQAQAAGASSYKITEAFTGNRVHMTAELNK
jgi:hypothetical protein